MKALVYGPGIANPKHAVKNTANSLETVKELGYTAIKTVHESGTKEEHTAKLFRNVLTANALILLDGWEDMSEALTLGQIANNIGLPVYTLKNKELTEITSKEILAPLTPGFGVLAPDATDLLPHEEAAAMVLGARGAYYDTPLRNLGRTGLIWTGILQTKMQPDTIITAEDVALCMIGVKLAREAFRHKKDNLTDSHGYLMTVEMIREERLRNEEEEKGR